MPKGRRRLAFSFTLMLWGAFLSGLAPPSSATAIEHVYGEVDHRPNGKTKWAPAATGQALDDGSQVRVGPDSQAVLALDDGSRIELGPNSLFTVELIERTHLPGLKLYDLHKPGQVIVKLAKGYLMALIHRPSPGFEVRSPTAVASVRGTRFSVSVDPKGNAAIQDISGSVAVTDMRGRKLVLRADQSVTATSKGLGPLRTLPTPVPIPGTAWVMDRPEGYEETAAGAWKRQTESTVIYRGNGYIIRSTERILAGSSALSWEKDQPWPASCGTGLDRLAQPLGQVRPGMSMSRPTFSFDCAEDYVPNSREPKHMLGARYRFFDVAADFDGQVSSQALRVAYSHTVKVTSDVDAEGWPPGADHVFAESRSDNDGPTVKAFLDAIKSLRPEREDEPASEAILRQVSPPP